MMMIISHHQNYSSRWWWRYLHVSDWQPIRVCRLLLLESSIKCRQDVLHLTMDNLDADDDEEAEGDDEDVLHLTISMILRMLIRRRRRTFYGKSFFGVKKKFRKRKKIIVVLYAWMICQTQSKDEKNLNTLKAQIALPPMAFSGVVKTP